ncbi:MAG TPA: hypothetical protein PLY34_15035 [Ferruginibacter sp.]|nr:hypothetical protein [Ferruginibacter sp.]HPH92473.1 hypothetical protein [Ferruginibacter sp.]
MNKITALALILMMTGTSASAQIDLDKILDPKKIININDILGKALNVKKGFAPKFSLGKLEIPKVAKVAEIFNVKGNAQALKLFNTFKTGRTIYRAAAIAGSAIAVYGTIKSLDKAVKKQDYQGALIGGLSTIGAGLISKFLTKAAAYKAVDVFNGVVRKKIGDIIGVRPAESTLGVGLFVKL